MLLASRISLKAIQEWLGHSDFTVTANIYAHLDFNSKKASANAMTWLGNTSLALETEAITPIPTDTTEHTGADDDLAHSLPNFMHTLLVSGVELEDIQVWLKQAETDLAKGMSLSESFREYQILTA